MRRKTSIIGLAFTLGLLCHEASGQTILTGLVKYTLQHSRDIKKAELQLTETDYLRKEAIGHGLPQIEASATYSKMMLPEVLIPSGANDQIMGITDLLINESATAEQRQGIANSINGVLDKLSNLDALYTGSLGIQVTQLIYSRSYWVGVKTAKKTQELYSILKAKTEEDVIAEVATGYYQAGSLMLQLETVEKQINNLKDLLRIAELSYKNDFLKESSVNRLQVTIANLEVVRETLQNGVDIQLNYLKALAGMPGDTLLTIDTRTLVEDFVSQEQAFSLENVPSYRLMLKQDELYSQQVELSQAKFYPTVAAFGKFSYSSYNFSSEIDKLSNMNTFGLSLSIPIFSSGVNNAKLKQSQLKQAELREDILKASDLLAVNYNNAFLEYQTAGRMLAAQRQNRELALKVYNQTSLQYQEGMASMADVLNVNSDFLQADNSLNQQILKCKTARIKMLKATGNLKSLIQ